MICPVCQTIIEKEHEGYCPDCLELIENWEEEENKKVTAHPPWLASPMEVSKNQTARFTGIYIGKANGGRLHKKEENL